MEYGIFTSPSLEIAQTRCWSLCLYCGIDKSVVGAKLYNGVDGNKTLAAVVERDNKGNKTKYAYEIPTGQVFTNDSAGVRLLIGEKYGYDTAGMLKTNTIEISEPYENSSVSDKGIEYCLKQWRMGAFYDPLPDGMRFQMVTNKVEYVFMIQNNDCNIYCGASVNVPYDKGMFGSGQYFRIRNYQDNSKPFCRFECDLGNGISVPKVSEYVCESGKCTVTRDGLYWPVKRYGDDEIVLEGCGGDEYVYTRKRRRSEYFSFS